LSRRKIKGGAKKKKAKLEGTDPSNGGTGRNKEKARVSAKSPLTTAHKAPAACP